MAAVFYVVTSFVQGNELISQLKVTINVAVATHDRTNTTDVVPFDSTIVHKPLTTGEHKKSPTFAVTEARTAKSSH